jgi:mannose-6-phosphate isomerase-like protein (cupin superfamily)
MFYWFGSETMKKNTIQESSRRNFLRTATVAAAAGLTLGDSKLFAAPALGQGTAAAPDSFKLYTAEHLAEEWQALEKAPANKTIVMTPNYSIILTVEKAKSAKEFEWHEGRDHVIQIVDGATDYEIGGTPKGGHSTGPGEWLAPESAGATKMTLKKGDMLIVPRGTPHKRSTPDSVKLTIISSIGANA